MKIKRMLAIISFTLLIAFMFSQTAFAGLYDGVFEKAKFSTLIELDKGEIDAQQIRGFCVSTDGKFLFAGLLQANKRVLKLDSATGKILGEYKDAEPGYPKGLATDDRGNLYVGIANQANDGAVRFAIVDIASLKEITVVETDISGKVGVNGVATAKVGDKYFMYLITNYDTDRLYCYDVTDPAKPVLNKDFGSSSGYADLKKLLGNDGCDASYLAVDPSGVIYLTAKVTAGGKGDTVLKIAADGKSVITKSALVEPFGIAYRDGYLFVSTYNAADSKLIILNSSDLSVVTTITAASDASHFDGVGVGGDKIYIADAAYGMGDRILVSNAMKFPETITEKPADTKPPAAAQTADFLTVAVLAAAVSSMFIATRRKK